MRFKSVLLLNEWLIKKQKKKGERKRDRNKKKKFSAILIKICIAMQAAVLVFVGLYSYRGRL